MLKITGVYGRNTMITAAFVLTLMMLGCLGYIVAYNNMAGATSATQEQRIDSTTSNTNSIDQLFSNTSTADSAPAVQPAVHTTTQASTSEGFSLGLPKLSQASLADADSWFWLAFASGIFFVVTTVAALFMQTFENNLRNAHIGKDYAHRRRQFAQLHLLELADMKEA